VDGPCADGTISELESKELTLFALRSLRPIRSDPNIAAPRLDVKDGI
jgi:hypothetical protein